MIVTRLKENKGDRDSYLCFDPINKEHFIGPLYKASCFRTSESAIKEFQQVYQLNIKEIETLDSLSLNNDDFDYHINYLFKKNWHFLKGNEVFQIYKRDLCFLGIKIDPGVPYKSNVTILKRRLLQPDITNNTFSILYKGSYFFHNISFRDELLFNIKVFVKPSSEPELGLYTEISDIPPDRELIFLNNLLNNGKN